MSLERTPDRGPRAQDDVDPRHRARARTKKPWAIECRYQGRFFSGAYHLRYATKARRDQALSTLRQRRDLWSTKHEYRAIDPE
jgi:hypothetical protein